MLRRLGAAVACLVVTAVPVTPAVTIAITILIVVATILLDAHSPDPSAS